MIAFFKPIARDERGASIIEMAMVTPVLGSMLIGMVDISRAYSSKLQLEQSAYRAIERVQQYQADESTYDTLKNESVSAAQAAGFTTVTTNDVTLDFWLECNGTRQSTYEMSCPDGQSHARWVTVDVQAKFWPMFSSSKWPGSNTDGSYTLHGRAGLRTQ